MPRYEDHIKQAKSNLKFLEIINQHTHHFDWQVTVCFYSALHLINAHLSKLSLQYRNHTDVKNALNPYNELSMGRLPEDEFLAYEALSNLSRRARYLVNTKDNQLSSEQAAFTYDKHLVKSIRHLEKILCYFDKKYSLALSITPIKCELLNKEKFKYFEIIKS